VLLLERSEASEVFLEVAEEAEVVPRQLTITRNMELKLQQLRAL
jgi:hypothetical protein